MNRRERSAYFAGLIDGEGTVTICKATRKNGDVSFDLYVTCVNTNADVLYALKDFAACGGISSRIPAPGRKRLYHFSSAGRPAAKLLRAIEPFSIIKREQIQLALVFQEAKRWFRAMRVPVAKRGAVKDAQRRFLAVVAGGKRTNPQRAARDHRPSIVVLEDYRTRIQRLNRRGA